MNNNENDKLFLFTWQRRDLNSKLNILATFSVDEHSTCQLITKYGLCILF